MNSNVSLQSFMHPYSYAEEINKILWTMYLAEVLDKLEGHTTLPVYFVAKKKKNIYTISSSAVLKISF